MLHALLLLTIWYANQTGEKNTFSDILRRSQDKHVRTTDSLTLLNVRWYYDTLKCLTKLRPRINYNAWNSLYTEIDTSLEGLDIYRWYLWKQDYNQSEIINDNLQLVPIGYLSWSSCNLICLKLRIISSDNVYICFSRIIFSKNKNPLTHTFTSHLKQL